MTKPLEDNIPVYEAEARSFASWIVFAMRKLQFFSKVGLVIWPLIGSASMFPFFIEVLPSEWPTDIAQWINIVMFLIFFLDMAVIPASVYLLECRVPDLFKRRDLKPPLYTWFMVLPFALNTIAKVYETVVTYPSVGGQPAGEVAVWLAQQFAGLLGTSIYYAIPPFFFGVVASNFMGECGSVNKARATVDHEVVSKGTKLLEVYASVQEGTQFGLFTQFTVHTLLTITLGFLIVVSNTCLSLNRLYIISYLTALVMSVLILCYFGFIMDDCYQRFQGISDDLRSVYVRSTNIQTSKELLVLIQLIEKQAPFTALGFFTVDRSTLMAELGTVLTYFVILIQSDFCT